ncbi:MAG TPA: YdcH family protein [Polyangiaceae bacterium]|nr:YdcH family protein [Polyangiaceae bacterium]
MKLVEVTAMDRLHELEIEHRALDDRLRILSRRAYLTPDEQREASELKRKKLFAKDRLYALRVESD